MQIKIIKQCRYCAGLFGGTCNIEDSTCSSWATRKKLISTGNSNVSKTNTGHEFSAKKTKKYRFVREKDTGKIRLRRIRY